MSERHGGNPRWQSFPVSASGRVAESGETRYGSEWRESRNGAAEPSPYQYSREAGDREKQVADQLAGIRAEALRRARKRLGPGPLQRRGASRWEMVEDEGAAS